jgi:hypothetical protein
MTRGRGDTETRRNWRVAAGATHALFAGVQLPSGVESMPDTILVGADVESANESSAACARCGLGLLRQEGIPTTWRVTGRRLNGLDYAVLQAELAGRYVRQIMG